MINHSRILSFFLTPIILIVGSCSKDKAEQKYEPYNIPCADLQEPGIYFSSISGTWWNYRNLQGGITKFEITSGGCDDYQCASSCFNNLNIGINGDLFVTSAYHGLGKVSVSYSSIYSLKKDSVYLCPVAFAAMQVEHIYVGIEEVPARRVTVATDTIITLHNSITYPDVIVVKEYNQYHLDYYYLDYFAKNIGLIRRDSIQQTDTVQLLSLEDYFLAH